MNTFCSGFADDLEKFVQYRRASGSWNEYASHQNLVYFDHYCVDNYGGAPTLTQEMIDSWCVKEIPKPAVPATQEPCPQGSSLSIFPVGNVQL